MRRLQGARELLDGSLEARALEGNLRDLTRLNRWLGGVALSWRAVRPLIESRSEPLRMLDVGTGGADIPVALARRARAIGRRLDVVATDIRAGIVAVAAANAAAAHADAIEVRRADADLASEADKSFDVVHSSLVLHHHEPSEARSLLGQMARVGRSAVIVNDLDRGWLWWLGAWLLSHLFTFNRYTRHDAPLSVRRAYRPLEVVELARSAGLREASRHRHLLRYRYAIVFVPVDVPQQ